MSQALNNALGEAAHRRHVLALLAEWEALCTSAHGGETLKQPLLVTARLMKAGGKLAAALSLAVLGEDIGKGESA
jgi:hypothetical protein